MNLKFFAIAMLLVPTLVFAQDSGKKKAYYFYGEQCPHCQNVDEYFQENGIYEKYDITKLEFSNPFNARLLMKFGEKFNSEYKGSVPAIAFAGKFLVGDTPIIEKFVREIDAAENANELPDPEKMNSGEEPSGNKKNYFPVIIGALIVVTAGALIYINRKKA